jgi:PAS domain S-box-containing protein
MDWMLETLVRISPAAIIGLNAREEIDLWSAAAVELFGWTEAEITGKPLPPGLSLDANPITAVVNAKDGQVVEVEVRSAPRPGGGWMLMAADLTLTTKTARDANIRIKAESRFRELLEAAPDAIIEVDREGRIVLLNAAVESIFGYRREELLGQPVEKLIPEGAQGRHHAHRAAYWANPVTRPMGFGMILLARRRDGSEFPVEISLSPVKIDDGFRVTAIIRDVTAKQKAEEAIRAANQQLESQNRELDRVNKLKSEFLASMSHELRTPLHTIIGFTELLAEELEGPLNEKQKRFLGHVHQDSQHLLDLINDILDLSKIEAGQMELHPESFDASGVVSEAVNGIRPMAIARGVAVENKVPGETIVKADRVRFREILSNLLSNAVKFTPEGGSVRIERRSSLSGAAAGGMVDFCVADTGVGIAPEDHEAVFDKFRQVGSTTRGVREGTGLGLAIVKSFVEMHGGTISLDSAPGKGSRFTFTVPAGDSSPPMVLVIEDELGARELLASYLEPLGIRTEAASSADEGIRMARDLKPDAITLDILMPGKSGWRVLRELRATPETRGIPVFVVSVLDESPSMPEATEYLQKPLKKEALLQALRKHAPARFAMF